MDGGGRRHGRQRCKGCRIKPSGSVLELPTDHLEKIAGVEAVDTIMEAAQTRFFARAVADPSAVGDLWSASLNPSNSQEDWIEEGGSLLGSKQQNGWLYVSS